MCGIAGYYNQPQAREKAKQALGLLRDRGLDSQGIVSQKEGALGHNLHKIVGSVKQPLKGKGLLSANCEIYNWKELARKHKLKARNDAELLLKLLDRKGVKGTLKELDGVWAFAYQRQDKIYLSRDLFGVKPLWYALENGFSFASERKALEATGIVSPIELDPRHILEYNLKSGKTEFVQRKFLALKPSKLSKEKAKEKLKELVFESVGKRIPEGKFGLLLSGGIDSLLLAKIFQEKGVKFKAFFAYVQGLGEPRDLPFVKKAAKELKIDLKLISVKPEEVEKMIKRIVPLIESSNTVKVGVALPLYLACSRARKQGLKVIFSGLGADEIFGGYARFRESNDFSRDSLNLLMQMHENDLYRDDVVTMNNNLELRLPYLDPKLAAFALNLPKELKMSAEQNKLLLRELALELGVPREFAERRKTSAQYGSRFDKAIDKLARKAKAKGKSDYLSSFAEKKNLKLAALYSGGKDSNLSLWIMQRQNYEIKCLVSILPENEDSFMYQKPDLSFLELQSKALGIPLLVERTKGEKEKELAALEKALKRAKEEYGVQGVIAGALYSNYQRDRIQKICLALQLRLFSPLWHKPQANELRELVKHGFKFFMSKIAALGLEAKWLGKLIGLKEVEELEKINQKTGFNVAGEGGEFESLVVDGPNFQQRIVVEESERVMENEFTGRLLVKKAKLARKP